MLQGLFMRHNSFSGPLPDLSSLQYLERIWLDTQSPGGGLTGGIEWMANLPYLHKVHIEKQQHVWHDSPSALQHERRLLCREQQIRLSKICLLRIETVFKCNDFVSSSAKEKAKPVSRHVHNQTVKLAFKKFFGL
jgi:hypothetical protein